jgi:putative membrane protein
MSHRVFYFVPGLLCLCATANAGDSAFLKDACEGGLMEVKLGELALTNASSQQVKDFGQRMIADHGKMGQDIRDLAGKENVSLPSDISTKDKEIYLELSKMTGAAFDKAYIAYMVKDHQDDLGAFQREVDSGTDSDAKAMAAQTIPTIKEHLKMAQEIASRVAGQ